MKQKHRVAVITGASAGVGRAAVRAFAARGYSIGLVARGRERLEEARREVEDAGGHALVLSSDVSDPDQVEAAAHAVETELGPIDVWVNCAMVTVFSPVKEMRADEYRRVTEVTYLGYVHGTLTALRRMLPRNRGTIVQVSSALGLRSIPLQSAYCAAKHAIIGFTESLRSELLHDRSEVRVTMVHLPALNTPQFDWVRSRLPRRPRPVPPVFAPEIAARAILWSAEHPRRRQVTVGFPALKAIVGNKVAPGLLDRLLAKKGYTAQQAAEPDDPNRPDNLLAPPPGDPGSQGPYTAMARDRSWQLWATTHRRSIGLVAVAALGALVGARRLARVAPRPQ